MQYESANKTLERDQVECKRATILMKPDHMMETEHLQMLIDDPQSDYLWGAFGDLYGFRNGEVDDRTGEIFCPARHVELETYDSNGNVIDED